ncbi:hypothetical protein SAMN05421678_10825 [Actinopolymorpha cephalotaxi]|uniref:Uncharacterized protein n=1 Tax=Actinopolymorpha cephalotaxi TaxID=504797 RepID=A0A1I2U500_9ACTN|nr:hypothetical protein [Actinopolymorpha cephalotaxi]NYH86444.1 hypothetical protein [Actinopolymorpha cephalotaxi]SFG72194.1 hypothetical protein SAMN05421678_10825 [Actinopolymorpha cephalotaxi]
METLDPDRVVEQFAPVVEPLHRSVVAGVREASRTLGRLRLLGAQYAYLHSHLARAIAHEAFAHEPEHGRWRLVGYHGQNGAFWLSDDRWTARVLHSTSEKDVPSAGPNGARQAFYTNQHLFRMEADALVERHDFLVLWRRHLRTEEVLLRLVHTLEPWPHGTKPRIDLSMPLLPDVDEFRGLVFVPREDPDAGSITLPEEELQEETDHGDDLLR